MSKISLSPDASGTGIFTIASPNSNTNRTLTLPDDTGTIVTNSGNQAGSFTTLNTSGQVVFNENGADVDFRVEGDTDANLLFVDASTDRVGVGTSSPAQKLSVSGGNVQVSSASETTVITNGGNFTTGAVTDSAITKASGASLLIGTGSTEQFRIDSSGNVGIGTTSPASKLDVTGTSTRVTIIDTSNSAAGSGVNFVVKNGGTTVGNGTIRSDNADNMQFFNIGGERARITSGGYFKASNNGSYSENATQTYHEAHQSGAERAFVVGATNASYASYAQQIRVTRNTTNNTFYALGYFNVGANAYKFQVADSGNVTNTNNSYGSLSDVKLKQDIVDAGSQWDDIKGLRVRKYRWKSDPNGFMQMGLVAQEAEEVSPGLIDEHPDYEEVEVPVLDDEGNAVLNEDGTPQVTKQHNALGTTTKAVKYSILYMKAVKALQEAMDRIETLEAKVAALEGN